MLAWSKRRRWPRVILGAAVTGLVVIAVFITIEIAPDKPQSVYQEPQDKKEVKQAQVIRVNAGLPVRVKVPKINVDAPIDSVGLAENGDMEAPKGPRNIGWYKDSPRPGDTGNAIIAGHYGRWESGENSVFDNLSQLGAGDEVNVEDENGRTVVFIVQRVQIYNHNDDTQSIFISKDGSAHLNIITCMGDWIESEKTYSQRLVVFADRQKIVPE